MIIDFSSLPDENLLVGTLVNRCAELYEASSDCEDDCTHPSGSCSGCCRECTEQVHWHRKNGRTDYDCQKLLYYYVCRYAWKYCSEIMYALETLDLEDYPSYNILSIGCGSAPDLMAFEQINRKDKKSIYYRGFDINPFWEAIHNEIENYILTCDDIEAKFTIRDIFDVIEKNNPTKRPYNVIILEYLISHLPSKNRAELVAQLFNGLIDKVIAARTPGTPFLIIINDIDHYSVRNLFDLIVDIIKGAGYHGTLDKKHFLMRKQDYGDGSERYASSSNKFYIPENIKDNFNCAIECSSAQLIIELR